MASKRLLLVLGILVLLLSACGPEPAPRGTATEAPPVTAAKRVKLRMITTGELPKSGVEGSIRAAVFSWEAIAYAVMEPLVMYTKDGPAPRLATRWESSADLTKWRFYLRKGVKFHNGTDFTAQDVVSYANFLIKHKEESTNYALVPMKEAVAVDDYTVDLIFENPQPFLLRVGHFFLIPPVAITRDNPEMLKTTAIGTGPYRFVEWKQGQYVRLAKFEDYWGPKPQVDDVEMTWRTEEGVRVAALQAGEADFLFGLSQESASLVPKVRHMASDESIWLRIDEVRQKNAIFTDKRLRVAVEHAIDRQALIAIYGGLATPNLLGQFASPGDFGFNPGLKSRPYDLERAKALVKEAGATGKTVTMVACTDQWSKSKEIAEAVAYMIDQTGLKTKLVLMPHFEWSTYNIAAGQGGDPQHVTDLLLYAAETRNRELSRYRALFVAGGKNASIADPEVTRLYGETAREGDIAKMEEKLAAAYAYINEEAHYIPLLKLEWIWGLAKNLEWEPDIMGRPFIAEMRFTN